MGQQGSGVLARPQHCGRFVATLVGVVGLLCGAATTARADSFVPASGATSPTSVHASSPGSTVYTYSISVRGSVRTSLTDFVEESAGIYADPRGWSLGGSIHFVRVASGGNFTLWLSAASAMSSFSSVCDSVYNCTVGNNVIVNDDRWAFGSPAHILPLRPYHALIINHETGHWLGLSHSTCPGPGQLAFVMQQQSKGGSFLGPCIPNAWPRPQERALVAGPRGLPVVDNPLFAGIASRPAGDGYWLARHDGHVLAFGAAMNHGDLSGRTLNQPIVGTAATPDGGGYYLVASDGGVFTFGDAHFYGSTGGHPLNQPVVGMAVTPDGNGYWLVAADGGIFTFGDAQFFGSTGGTVLNQPVVGMASTPSGHGYRLVAYDGGVFTFGDAAFHGSTGAILLNQPIVGMATSPSGDGYWLVASDGGIFTFGNAGFHGSAGGGLINQPVVGMASSPDGGGYSLIASDGGLFRYGDAPFFGSGSP